MHCSKCFCYETGPCLASSHHQRSPSPILLDSFTLTPHTCAPTHTHTAVAHPDGLFKHHTPATLSVCIIDCFSSVFGRCLPFCWLNSVFSCIWTQTLFFPWRSWARSVPGAHRVHSRARSVPGAHRVHSRARSVPGAHRVHSRARSVPGAHRVHSRARSIPGARGVRSRARSVPGARGVRSRARSVPGAHRVHSRARSVPGAHRVHSRARSVPGARRVRSRARSVPGARGVRSRARSVPGARGVLSRARSVPGARGVRSRARSVPGARGVRSRARSVPGARGVRSRARSVPGARRVRSRARFVPGARGVRSGSSKSPLLSPLRSGSSRSPFLSPLRSGSSRSPFRELEESAPEPAPFRELEESVPEPAPFRELEVRLPALPALPWPPALLQPPWNSYLPPSPGPLPLHGPGPPSLPPFQLPPELLDSCFEETSGSRSLKGGPVMRPGPVLLLLTTRGRKSPILLDSFTLTPHTCAPTHTHTAVAHPDGLFKHHTPATLSVCIIDCFSSVFGRCLPFCWLNSGFSCIWTQTLFFARRSLVFRDSLKNTTLV